jgi:hypothetical protein
MAKLTDAERAIYIDAITKGKTLLDVAREGNFSLDTVVNRIKETGAFIPLTAEHEKIYKEAVKYGLTSEEVANRQTWLGNASNKAEVEALILGAGLAPLTGKFGAGEDGLPITPPATAPGEMPVTAPEIMTPPPISQGPNQYDSLINNMNKQVEGLLGQLQQARSTPANIMGSIPQTPSLRMVRKTARRQNDPNWRGQSNTILTSGQGVTGPAKTKVKTLLGS